MFDSTSFARIYLVTFWMLLLGTGAFVGGALATTFVARPFALLIIAGWISAAASFLVSGIAAYRELRTRGSSRYDAGRYAGPYSVPSTRLYRDYRSLLRQSH